MTPQLQIIKIWLFSTYKTWRKTPLDIPKIINSNGILETFGK